MEEYLKEIQTIIETNRKPFVILDPDLRIIMANHRFYKTFDVSPDQVLEKILYSIDNDDWDIDALHALLETDLPKGKVMDDIEIDHTYSRLGRRILRINAQSYCHEKIGKTLILLSIEDFTKRKLLEEQLKESEERFRRMFETSRDGLMLINKVNGAVKHINHAITDLLGIEPYEIIEKSFLDTGILGKEVNFQGVLEHLEVDGFFTRETTLLNRRSKAEFHAEIFLVNRASLIQCNVRDITERRRIEDERQRLHDQLLQAQRLESVGRLAGGIAHDFNNILSVIVGYSQLMLENLAADHPHHEALEEVLKAAFRASALTRQMLAFGRKQVLEINKEDLNGIIKGFKKLIRRVIGEDLELQLSLTPQKLLVEVDVTQIEQVLMNLAVNARDAMPNGGVLKFETAVVELDSSYAKGRPGVTPGTYAMFAITDTGMGMDKETLAQIFDPFFTTKGKDKGTGLGLATCYGIVKQHGGNIWVYSEPGHGTTFKIYLPIATGSPKPSRRKSSLEESPGGGETVMVIEDDESVRTLTCAILTRCGYRVIESKSAMEAIAQSNQTEGLIDLVLTDVIMPDMKGPEAFHRIRERHPKAKVLYMSGYTDEVIVHKGILNQEVQFIQKPFSLQSLSNKVKEALRN
ncbi:hybrid sensor histidine kinase/response regulator [Desulfatitalea tepidiphila]|uniref:hybrid sensor histidine kinase/response regulator n=1 Tax=Desulfatitalea tepidiphila TaxID=1185843 RepID=UPI0006B520EF